ncbi:MAG: hypothetical protein C5B52_16395 [Bacteroidetes bacterium]|nr:MAG: hypothetical protein C5B52_16395 [Bacteroidota bacterium]
MKHKFSFDKNNYPDPLSILILLSGVFSAILASPKWSMSIFAWIAPACFLYYVRVEPVKRKFLWALFAFFIMHVASSYEVAPFPIPVLVIMALIESLKTLVLYGVDKWISSKYRGFAATLFFPATAVTLEYMNSLIGGGVWWSIANSQFGFPWLIQLSSITGVWGISFLIYWFASVLIWSIQNRSQRSSIKKGVLVYGSILFATLVFGAVRYNMNSLKGNQSVKIAGISVPLFDFLENLYRDYSGKSITIEPKTSISSGVLQEVNRAQIPFIESADTLKFKNGYRSMLQLNDSLFSLSKQAANRGAKIILWSEANAFAFRFNEKALISKGKDFAFQNKVYLMMAMAIIDTGRIYFGKKFIENKTVFIGPDGEILNVFHKNNPVPMVENSKPGDGKIPVIQTAFGRISPSICYDADFPTQMRQIGKNKTDILLLPSGDWYSISPFHTRMAIFRGIENGTAVVRQASGGLSVASDYRGRVSASLDFYKEGTKLWFADVEVGHVATLYSKIGNLVACMCIVFTISILGLNSFSWIRRKFVRD